MATKTKFNLNPLNYGLLSMIFSIIEICYCFYILGMCAYGLSHAHYRWITRLDYEFDIETLKISGFGMAISMM